MLRFDLDVETGEVVGRGWCLKTIFEEERRYAVRSRTLQMAKSFNQAVHVWGLAPDSQWWTGRATREEPARLEVSPVGGLPAASACCQLNV